MPPGRDPPPECPCHYPPEVLELLVEAIPLLARSKDALLDFFRRAGVPGELLAEWRERVRRDRAGVSKREITRAVLGALNELRDAAVAPRRAIVRQAATFGDFEACWDADRPRAEGLVGRVRALADRIDARTRERQERERERLRHRERELARAAAARSRRERVAAARRRLFALFAADPRGRASALGPALDALFAAHGIPVREAFRPAGGGDAGRAGGLVELDGHAYLVELQWGAAPAGPAEVAPHLVRVFGRAEAGGILISASGYTAAAVEQWRIARARRVCIFCTLEEILGLLEAEEDLGTFLREMARGDRGP